MTATDLRREQKRLLEQEKREEGQKREDEIKRKAEQREERLLLALKEAQPAAPQTVTIQNNKLPEMREGEEIETFIGKFDAALRAGNVPENQWCAKLHAQLEPGTKLKVQDAIQDPDATYDLAVAFARNYLNPTLKTYFDLKSDVSKKLCCRSVEEWLVNQPVGLSWHKKQETQQNSESNATHRPSAVRKQGSCFHCRKPGHYSKECRSRFAQERSQQQQQPIQSQIPVVTTEVASSTSRVKRDIICFNCRQKGHKSSQCPVKQNLIKKKNPIR